jgi:hypothetical protein
MKESLAGVAWHEYGPAVDATRGAPVGDLASQRGAIHCVTATDCNAAAIGCGHSTSERVLALRSAPDPTSRVAFYSNPC